MRNIEQKVEKHETDIGVLKYSFDNVVKSIEDNTKQSRELTQTLTVYITKHDGLENRMRELQTAQTAIVSNQLDHSKTIAAMKPVVDSLRGFVWKLTGAVILGGGGVAAVLTAIVGMSKHV